MEVENEIQFTDVSEVFIEDFDEGVDGFEDDQFVVFFVDDGDEVKRGVSLVDDFVLLVLEEVAHLGFAGDDQLVDLGYGEITSLRKRCFSCWERLWEYHLVSLERPCLLIKKKQWIMFG